MGDRIPIGTHPGLVSALVGSDLALAAFGAGAAYSCSAVFLRRTDVGAGDTLAAELRTAPGGGGTGAALALPAGVSAALIPIAPALTGEAFYLRVSAAAGTQMNLSGWFEVEAGLSGSVSAYLTTLARVKAFGGIATAAHDALLNTLIAAASARIEARIHRRIAAAAYAGETHDGGRPRVVLRHYPVASLDEVRLEGVALDPSGYALDAGAGILERRDGDPYAAGVWPCGRGILAVDYSAGYAVIPEDLAEAATLQAYYLWTQTKAGGHRFAQRGEILDPGGTAQYLVGPWAPGVPEILAAWTSRSYPVC